MAEIGQIVSRLSSYFLARRVVKIPQQQRGLLVDNRVGPVQPPWPGTVRTGPFDLGGADEPHRAGRLVFLRPSLKEISFYPLLLEFIFPLHSMLYTENPAKARKIT